MIIVYNEIIFDANKLGEATIVKKSTVEFNPINTQFQTSYVYKLQLSSVELQDSVLDLDSLTEIEDDNLFALTKMPDRSYEKDYNAQYDLTIEMHLDALTYKREGYHILDFASDIGGF